MVHVLQFERQEHQAECVKAILEHVSGKGNDLRAQTDGLPIPKKDNRLDILMETATGKTLTYLMCMMEMNGRLGASKFMIVVPSRAIKQGVVQNIEITKDYLFGMYGKRLRLLAWPENENAVSEFLGRGGMEPAVLLVTYSSFNSIRNKLNDRKEDIVSGMTSLWERLVAQRPVVIMDEPHKLAGSRTTKYLDRMRDGGSLFLRFGASFPEGEHGLSNVVYELNSADAFNGSLVKEIEVSTVSHAGESGGRVTDVRAGRQFSMNYTINGRNMEATVQLGKDIGAITGLTEYNRLTVTKIGSREVVLNNGMRLAVGGYEVEQELMRSMVATTVERHFEREAELFGKGIKTLSLFFIPHVSDFRGEEPRVKKMFEEEYKRIRGRVYESTSNHEYRKYLDRDYDSGALRVHEGYFSGDRGSVEERQAEGVNMILNEKERLLSLDTPLRFIFSVWALQEGWDNPNIFNICKLTNTDRETTRRQQVGRGLRLAVDQQGRRMTRDRVERLRWPFSQINTLNMVVSSHETDFFSRLQKEIGSSNESIPLKVSMLAEYGLSDSESVKIWGMLESNAIIDEEGNRLRSIYEFLARYDTLGGIPSDRYARLRDKFRQVPAVRERGGRRMINIKEREWNKFKELWEALNRRAKVLYRDIDEESIIDGVCHAFNSQVIDPVTVSVERVGMEESEEAWTRRGVLVNVQTGEIVRFFRHHSMAEYAADIARDLKLPLRFMLGLFGGIDKSKMEANPEEAGRRLKTLIREEIHRTVLSKVEYMFNETVVYGNQLQTDTGEPRQSMPYTFLGHYYEECDRPNYLYDAIAYDADIELDSIKNDPDVINGLEITVFAKLPKINIGTPYGTYNPDFAYLVRGGHDKIFLVVETKGYDIDTRISEQERIAMGYGKRFFACLEKAMPKVKIHYVQRINRESLASIMGRIMQ